MTSMKTVALVQPNLEAGAAHAVSSLRPASVPKAFGLRNGTNARFTCSLQEDIAKRVADASKIAATTLAVTVLTAGIANANPPRLTYDQIRSKTYMEVKGTGIANQCPIIDKGDDEFKFKPGSYTLTKLCLEPTSFKVKKESAFKPGGAAPEESFVDTKLMTRLTYTLDEIEGPLTIKPDGTIKFEEKEDGLDYAAVTVQLPGAGRERVPFLFTIKGLVAEGKPESFGGTFNVPSYRGSSFLDPKGRGGSTGYDNAVALPAGGRGDEDELAKENSKDVSASTGNISFKVSKVNAETGEIAGVFESIQPSDTDLGSKAPKDVKIEGIWYAQIE